MMTDGSVSELYRIGEDIYRAPLSAVIDCGEGYPAAGNRIGRWFAPFRGSVASVDFVPGFFTVEPTEPEPACGPVWPFGKPVAPHTDAMISQSPGARFERWLVNEYRMWREHCEREPTISDAVKFRRNGTHTVLRFWMSSLSLEETRRHVTELLASTVARETENRALYGERFAYESALGEIERQTGH